MAREWPLVAFTLLGQLAVGLYLFIGGPLFLDKAGLSGVAGRRLLTFVALGALGLMTAAAALSVFHLHHPLRAYKALSNLRTSWLSREILFELAFMGGAGFLAVCVGRGIGGRAFVQGLYGLGALSGLLFIFSMARLYRLSGIPSWNRSSTLFSFFLTCLFLGVQASLVFFGFVGEAAAGRRIFVTAGFFLAAASFVYVLLSAPPHGFLAARPEPSLRPRASGTAVLWMIRLVLASAAALAMAVACFDGRGKIVEAGGRPAASALFAAAFVIVLAGEIVGRLAFYGQASLTWERAAGRS